MLFIHVISRHYTVIAEHIPTVKVYVLEMIPEEFACAVASNDDGCRIHIIVYSAEFLGKPKSTVYTEMFSAMTL